MGDSSATTQPPVTLDTPSAPVPTPLSAQSNTRWLKSVLIPFWVIRDLALLLWLVSCFIALADKNYRVEDGSKAVKIVILVIVMVAIGLGLIVDAISMIRLARHRLRPDVFLVDQICMMLCWIGYSIFAMVGMTTMNSGFDYFVPYGSYVKGRTTPTSRLGYLAPYGNIFAARICAILILGVLIDSCLALLIYAAVMYHRSRKSTSHYNNYASAQPHEMEHL